MRQPLSKARSAFTMVELILVTIILGIVSSIGAEIIANAYESFIIQRAHHRASIKTELTVLQVANRLRYAIPGTIYRIKNDDTLESLESPMSGSGSDYKGLQWVSYDGNSFEAITSDSNRIPGWSGFIDVDNAETDTSHLKTLGSDLELTNNIIQNLSPSGKDISDAYVYFPNRTFYPIASASDDLITLNDTNSKTIYEHYKLAWSSYALVVEDGDLWLYYDFNAAPASDKGETKERLAKNIKTFKFKGAGNTIRFKLCTTEQISEDYNVTSCKEKAVF